MAHPLPGHFCQTKEIVCKRDAGDEFFQLLVNGETRTLIIPNIRFCPICGALASDEKELLAYTSPNMTRRRNIFTVKKKWFRHSLKKLDIFTHNGWQTISFADDLADAMQLALDLMDTIKTD